ncbi:hypothetical protein B0H19DRAFT_930241, partial [Mycena capillaripes]
GVIDTITDSMPPDWDYGASMTALLFVSRQFQTYMHVLNEELLGQKRYYGAHYPRFPALKKTYDPANPFRAPKSLEL